MKSMRMVKWISVSLLAFGLSVSAKDPGADKGADKKDGDKAKKAPNAEKLMTKFDANTDGKLDQTELTQAITSLREHKHKGGEQAEQGGDKKTPPPAEKIAARMIKKFSSDQTGLTKDELAKALAAHHEKRAAREGGDKHEKGGQDGDGK